jgi:hypothetical protein
MAVSGLRLLIGVGSLAAASGLKVFAGTFHADSIRIPMMILAVGGSVINLYVIWPGSIAACALLLTMASQPC